MSPAGFNAGGPVGAPQFTPGPWQLGEYSRGYTEIDAAQGAVEWYGMAKVVTRLTGDGDRKDHPQGIANARLIAAAPELYEALAALADHDLAYVDASIVIDCGSHGGALERARKARAALAKARGESA